MFAPLREAKQSHFSRAESIQLLNSTTRSLSRRGLYSMNALAQVAAHNLTSVREGLKIVRNVVANNPAPTGFTTAELFKLATKETPPADFKPHILPTRPDIVRKKQQPKYPKHQQQKPEPVPPRPDHPIRSMRYVDNLFPLSNWC